MRNFIMDSYYTNRLRKLSETTDLSEVELVEKMFYLFEEEQAYRQLDHKEIGNKNDKRRIQNQTSFSKS